MHAEITKNREQNAGVGLGLDSPEVRDIFRRLAKKRVPAGSLLRLWTLGSAQAGIALTYLGSWLRGGFASQDSKEKLRNEAHLAAALKLLSTMGYMRGAVMKIGQAMASYPDLAPAQFVQVLGHLHFEAPPMHFSLIREVFRAEMGAEPHEIFADFETTPCAAASLGQVHKARLQSGELVAVKIQYPHMGKTISADMANLRFLLNPMRFTSGWPNLMEVLADIEKMLEMEADYRQEAHFCQEAQALFEDRDDIVIPKIFKDFSCRRILTMEYVDGLHLDEYLAGEPSQEDRNRYVDLIARVSGRLYYRGCRLFADPHPGNFIFMGNGRLGVVDFGCTKTFTQDEWKLQHNMEEAYVANDEEKLHRLVANTCYFQEAAQMKKGHLSAMCRALEWHLGPVVTKGVVDWGDEVHLRRGVRVYKKLVVKGYARGMPLYLWFNRFTFGFRSIFYRLQGRHDYHALCSEEKMMARHG